MTSSKSVLRFTNESLILRGQLRLQQMIDGGYVCDPFHNVYLSMKYVDDPSIRFLVMLEKEFSKLEESDVADRELQPCTAEISRFISEERVNALSLNYKIKGHISSSQKLNNNNMFGRAIIVENDSDEKLIISVAGLSGYMNELLAILIGAPDRDDLDKPTIKKIIDGSYKKDTILEACNLIIKD